MNENERISLQRMISENNVEDQTDKIRMLKHSDLIKNDVITLQNLKEKYKRNKDSKTFDSMCVSRCNFLFNNYTDIFNRVKKDELDMNILSKLLFYLKKIENGELDQHTGSYEVGKVLKSLYIDSALKKADKHDKEESKNKPKLNSGMKLSWQNYKSMIE